jgi:RNA polymerase sigma factor (sigma-70 family)
MTRGDDEFADFARLSSGWLIQTAYLLTGDRLEAEELAQATLVRTYAAWPRVRRDGAHAYARTVLMNLTRDRWRRPLREQAAAEVPDRADSRDLADDVTTRRLLVELLDTLAPQERAVILLRHYFDLSEAQTDRTRRCFDGFDGWCGYAAGASQRCFSEEFRRSLDPPWMACLRGGQFLVHAVTSRHRGRQPDHRVGDHHSLRRC